MKKIHPLMPSKCATCPFRPGSKYEHLSAELTRSALTSCSRICHSTGTNAIGGRTGKPSRLCRGARDVQLYVLHNSGFLEAPTDEAWAKKWAEVEPKFKRRAKRVDVGP